VTEPDESSDGSAGPRVVGESRWPAAVAILMVLGLTSLLPDAMRLGPRLLVPVIELVLLGALVVVDPGKIDRTTKWTRALSLALVTVLIVEALWATGRLVDALIKGTDPAVNDAFQLLAVGAIVWVSNNIAFALLYWELDSGGSAARAHFLPEYPDLAFPQQQSPVLAPADWRPRFADYLYLGFTNATAFSPTDVMPLAPWAKVAMTVQALISLLILGLVIARAVNVMS
jgi:uncharacterized membrane protein